MSKRDARDLLEEMQWKYAGGPVPRRRRDAAAWAAMVGCVLRFVVAFAFCVLVLLVIRWLW